jgi:dTDP-4-dehydrorhamnose 3,5-epimerase
MFCKHEFEELGLIGGFVQVNNSFSVEIGTLRGMHYQLAPHAETKVIRCVHGTIWDCILDLRPQSATFGKWFGAELSADNRLMMYAPKGFAHGFVTLSPNVEVLYLVDEFYAPESERIIRWNDSRFCIKWPLSPTTMSSKDEQAPDFERVYHLGAGAEK